MVIIWLVAEHGKWATRIGASRIVGEASSIGFANSNKPTFNKDVAVSSHEFIVKMSTNALAVGENEPCDLAKKKLERPTDDRRMSWQNPLLQNLCVSVCVCLVDLRYLQVKSRNWFMQNFALFLYANLDALRRAHMSWDWVLVKPRQTYNAKLNTHTHTHTHSGWLTQLVKREEEIINQYNYNFWYKSDSHINNSATPTPQRCLCRHKLVLQE